MARIPETEIEQLKKEVSVERLIEAAGIELRKSGKDKLGVCPFHADREPSLVVTPAKNLWHCFGCGAAGGPIDWVMQHRKVSFRRAVEELRAELGHPSSLAAKPLLAAVPPLKNHPDAVTTDNSSDQAVLQQVLAYYQTTLLNSPEALAYLEKRGLNHPELIQHFRLGYANRTLAYHLPIKQLKAGAEVRGRLQALGVLRESGHEHFNGSVVIPVVGTDGAVHELYGRKIRDNLRPGTAYHLYLPGPHAGVWNEAGIAASGGEVILCESLIDALTFWAQGYRNVTSCYGVNGFTDELQTCLQQHGIQRVLIAFDRDDAGQRAALALAERLQRLGIACFRVLFPQGMDANEFAVRAAPHGGLQQAPLGCAVKQIPLGDARQALGTLLRQAEWLGNGKAPALSVAQTDPIAMIRAVLPQAENPSSFPHSGTRVAAPQALPTSISTANPTPIPPLAHASPLPHPPGDVIPCEQQGQDLIITLGEQRYRVRGWQKPLNPETLKVNLMVSQGERFHVDTLDLYNARARVGFIKQAGLELGLGSDTLKHDLGRVLRQLEHEQAAVLEQALSPKNTAPVVSEAERIEALAWLQSPDLLTQLLQDFAALGVVGEESNKLVGYLAAVSRLLDRPLALLIQSSSAAGKSSLMDAVLALMPEEAQLRYSAMTGQSLFYMGSTNLQHKILAIAEEEGAQQASYALKLLQSDGRVTMASTGKDPHTGQLVTQEYSVEGPVMLFLTTTAIDIDDELMNRCLVLSVNESREQTRAIHVLQRQRETLEGLLANTARDALIQKHRNAQRLLQPLAVVNPFAAQLSFRDDQTRSRRDHLKYLTLIRCITLLHQYQRPIKTLQHAGQTLAYLEVEASDIELANRLAHDILGRSLDELPPQTRKLLNLLLGWVKTECAPEQTPLTDYRFTRKQVRAATGWGDTQLKIHLARLVDLEYLLVHRRGTAFAYELVYHGEGEAGGRFLLGLTSPTVSNHTNPHYDAERSGFNPLQSDTRRPLVGHESAPGHIPKSVPETTTQAPSCLSSASQSEPETDPETATASEHHFLLAAEPLHRNPVWMPGTSPLAARLADHA